MELKEFANLIDGRQYDYRMFTKEELQLAKDNRIVIVTGASDDLVELEGAITTRFGNTRHKNVFKEFYQTNIGEFTPEKWLEVTLQIIQTLMENELLEEIKEHVAGHCVWLKNDKEIEEYSASCLASGAYMYWEDFKDKRLPAHKVFIFEVGDF